MRCKPTFTGIVLRVLVAVALISYGLYDEVYLALLIGVIPLIRLSYYALSAAYRS